MRIFDISWILDAGMLVYPKDPGFAREKRNAISEDGYAMEVFTLGAHVGTHLDAPAHVLPGGKTLDQFPLEQMNGSARVLDARNAGNSIGADFLSHNLPGEDLQTVERLLLRTSNGRLLADKFDADYASLSLDGAEFLRDKTHVRLVGIDYLSIENGTDLSFPVHRALLNHGILILEGLNFETEPEAVAAGDYDLLCAPLRIRNADGAPCRAALRELVVR